METNDKKTAEEILAKNCRYFDDYGGLDEIYKSMEEYKNQFTPVSDGVEFAEWIEDSNYVNELGLWYDCVKYHHPKEAPNLTSAELYTLFKTAK